MTKKQVSWFMIGVTMGAGVWVLLAPRSGRDTRHLIATKAGEGKAFLIHTGTRARCSADRVLDRGRMTLEHANNALTAAVGAGKAALFAHG